MISSKGYILFIIKMLRKWVKCGINVADYVLKLNFHLSPISPLRQVIMPQQHGSDGAIRLPLGGGFGHLFFGGFGRQFFYFLEGVYGGQVADGEDIGAAEDEHEVHVDGPMADAFEGDELGAYLMVGQAFQLGKAEPAAVQL